MQHWLPKECSVRQTVTSTVARNSVMTGGCGGPQGLQPSIGLNYQSLMNFSFLCIEEEITFIVITVH